MGGKKKLREFMKPLTVLPNSTESGHKCLFHVALLSVFLANAVLDSFLDFSGLKLGFCLFLIATLIVSAAMHITRVTKHVTITLAVLNCFSVLATVFLSEILLNSNDDLH